MMFWKPNRTQALDLLLEYNQNEALLRHAYAVEGVMRHFASLYHADNVETWGIIGLLHDLDYEQYPDQHCHKTRQILIERNLDPEWIRAIISHGYSICTDVEPQSDLEKVLFTIDELTGLIAAAALMRPSRSVLDLELKSLKKKFKTSSFAAGVNRDIIRQGSDMMDWELDHVMQETIAGMRTVATDIGLAGESDEI